jgi:hypothetical protein
MCLLQGTAWPASRGTCVCGWNHCPEEAGTAADEGAAATGGATGRRETAAETGGQCFMSRLKGEDNNKTKLCDLSPRANYTQPSDRRLSAKLVPTLADRRCRVVSAMDPHGLILGFLGWSRYFFFQVAPQLYSRGSVDSVPDPLLLRKSDSAGNRTRDLWICSH